MICFVIWWIAYSKSVFAAENEYDVPRATVEETVNFMIGLLDEAATVLPWDLTEDGEANWQGRMTKAAAMGLKCKILLLLQVLYLMTMNHIVRQNHKKRLSIIKCGTEDINLNYGKHV